MTLPIFSIIGFKNSGKTTLVCRLIEYFTQKNMKVAVVKHAHHEFDIDKPGTDSFKHRQSGACQIIVSSDQRTAIIKEHLSHQKPSLAHLITYLEENELDLILVEGFKQEPIAKLALLRADKNDDQAHQELTHVQAFAGVKKPPHFDAPFFQRDDTEAIAEFIIERLDLKVNK